MIELYSMLLGIDGVNKNRLQKKNIYLKIYKS